MGYHHGLPGLSSSGSGSGSRSWIGQRSGSMSISSYQYNSYITRTTTSSTTTSRPTTTTTRTTITSTTSTTATPTVKISSNCSITLYEGEYHGGAMILLTENVPDLSILNFQNKVQSVKVVGWCKWIIYSGKNYTGYTREFIMGEKYVKRTDFGRLYLNAKSLEMLRF